MSRNTSPVSKTHASGIWVLLSCALQVLVTSVHHVQGALIYSTPGRYLEALIAIVVLVLATAALWVSTASRTVPPVERVAWWTFWGLSLTGFVLAFGAFEGLFTHVIAPIVEGGYHTPGEPFDLFFQATGVLHLVPAAITANLLARLARARRGTAAAPLPAAR